MPKVVIEAVITFEGPHARREPTAEIEAANLAELLGDALGFPESLRIAVEVRAVTETEPNTESI